MSQPTRAAWIEIIIVNFRSLAVWSQPTRAAWIEIPMYGYTSGRNGSRSPLGLRGLKSQSIKNERMILMSQPTRAAWIEILRIDKNSDGRGSQPTRAAWIEI